MLSSQSNIVLEAIEEYNKYRSPESKARLVLMAGDVFKVEFTGSFCYTCGFYDYFEDYKFLLEDMGLITEITEIEELEEGAIVTFRIISQKE